MSYYYPSYAGASRLGLRLTRKIFIAIALAVSVASVAGGWAYYQFFWPRIEGLTWEIVVVEGKPVLKVDFRTNVYPVVVRLLNAEKRVVDEVEVSIPEDIPAILHIPLMIVREVANVIPGMYYLRILHKGKVLVHQDVEVALAVELHDIMFSTKYFVRSGWYLMGLNLTVSNAGNCPVIFNNIKVEAEGRSIRFWLPELVILKPGRTRSLSVRVDEKHEALYLGRSGTHDAKVILELGSKSFTKEAVISIPSPVLVAQAVDLGVYYDMFFEAWVVDNATLTIKNVGEGTAYIYSVEFHIPAIDAYDKVSFSEPVVLKPGETITLQEDIHIKVAQPGEYNVTVRLDMKVESWSFETTLKIEAPVLVIKDASFSVEKIGYEWWLEGVSVTIENVGNVTGYVLRVYVFVEDVGWDYNVVYESVAPGETKTITAAILIDITSPGTYNVTVEVDLGFTTITYETTLTVG